MAREWREERIAHVMQAPRKITATKTPLGIDRFDGPRSVKIGAFFSHLHIATDVTSCCRLELPAATFTATSREAR
jgi:hypothetical protein